MGVHEANKVYAELQEWVNDNRESELSRDDLLDNLLSMANDLSGKDGSYAEQIQDLEHEKLSLEKE